MVYRRPANNGMPRPLLLRSSPARGGDRLNLHRTLPCSLAAWLMAGACAGGTGSAGPIPADSPTQVRPVSGKGLVLGILKSSCGDAPLQGAVVGVRSGIPSTFREMAHSDAQGVFVLGPLEPGPYRIEILAIAHRRQAREVIATAEHIDTLRLTLTYSTLGLIEDCIARDKDGNALLALGPCPPKAPDPCT